MKTLLTILSLAFVIGCKNTEGPPRPTVERRQGHVTLVAGGADFVVTKPVYRRFQAPAFCFPESVWAYLKSQPSHMDSSSLNLKGNAAWVDVTGHIEKVPSYDDEVFVTDEIHQIGPAQPRYLAWRKSPGHYGPRPGYVD